VGLGLGCLVSFERERGGSGKEVGGGEDVYH
jgi:hypothetical protein